MDRNDFRFRKHSNYFHSLPLADTLHIKTYNFSLLLKTNLKSVGKGKKIKIKAARNLRDRSYQFWTVFLALSLVFLKTRSGKKRSIVEKFKEFGCWREWRWKGENGKWREKETNQNGKRTTKWKCTWRLPTFKPAQKEENFTIIFNECMHACLYVCIGIQMAGRGGVRANLLVY